MRRVDIFESDIVKATRRPQPAPSSLLVGRAQGTTIPSPTSPLPTSVRKPRSPTAGSGTGGAGGAAGVSGGGGGGGGGGASGSGQQFRARLEPLMLDLKVNPDVLPRLMGGAGGDSVDDNAQHEQSHHGGQQPQQHSSSRSTSATYADIQNAWALFSTLNDTDKNAFIKGILSHCTTRQVNYICQELNLRLSTVSSGFGNTLHLHTLDAHTKLTKSEYNRHSTTDDVAAAEAGSGAGGGGQPKRPPPPLPFPTDKDWLRTTTKMPDRYPMSVMTTPPLPQLHGKAVTVPTSMANTNMFVQLFDSKHSPVSFLSQIPHADTETVRQFAQFTAVKCQKLQTILDIMNSVAAQVDLQRCSECLINGVATVINSSWHTVYLINDLRQAVVQASNWLPFGQIVPLSNIFGEAALDRGEQINLYQAVASEHYTDACHSFYEREEINSILSLPLMLENGKLLAVVEFINKRKPDGAAHFFDAEDEFMARSTVSTWTMLLREAKAETERTLYILKILRTLAKLSEANRDELDLQQAAILLSRSAVDLVPMELAHIVLFSGNTRDEDRDVPEVVDARMICPEPSPSIRALIESQLATLRSEKQLINIAHAINNPTINTPGMDVRIRNLLMVPVVSANQTVLGVLFAINRLPDISYFTTQDEQMLSAFMSVVSLTARRKLQLFKLYGDLAQAHQEIEFLTSGVLSTDISFAIIDKSGKLLRLQNGQRLSLTAIRNVTIEAAIGRDNQQLLADIKHTIDTRSYCHCEEYGMRVTSSTRSAKALRQAGQDPGKVIYINYRVYPCTEDRVVLCMEEVKDDISIGALRSRMFESSVSRSLSDQPAPLNGVSNEGSVLLVNIRDFTTALAPVPAEELMTVLSLYYTIIKTTAERYKGFLLHPTSDKVLCVFGVPLARSENQDMRSCIACALEIHKELATLKKTLTSRHIDIALQFVITVCSGIVTAGLTKYARSMQYTVSGEPTHDIFTLNHVAMEYNTTLVIDKATHEKVKSQFDFREIDTLPGGQPVEHPEDGNVIYNVLGPLGVMLDDSTKTAYICYELGLTEYRQRNYDAALTYFRKAKSLIDDGPSAMMMTKCKYAMDTPHSTTSG